LFIIIWPELIEFELIRLAYAALLTHSLNYSQDMCA